MRKKYPKRIHTEIDRERKRGSKRTKIVVVIVIKCYILYEYKHEFFLPRVKGSKREGGALFCDPQYKPSCSPRQMYIQLRRR